MPEEGVSGPSISSHMPGSNAGLATVLMRCLSHARPVPSGRRGLLMRALATPAPDSPRARDPLGLFLHHSHKSWVLFFLGEM